ncbi:MAG: TonB-dependent receptor [Woeseiaceae bacterium]
MKSKKEAATPTVRKTAVATAVAMSLAAPAMAQQPIDEITVTATKRESSVQDLAVAVTAISDDMIKDLQLVNIVDIDKTVPGLKVRYVGADPTIIMRGAGAAGTNDIAVPVYVDGLYRPRAGQGLAGFLDIERVEVLRGPQGTLFGRNTFGGLVNVIAKKPDASQFDFGFAANGGDYSYGKFEGFVNVPFSDTVALRVTASNTQRDPIIENTFNSSYGMRDEDNTYARAQLSIAPSDVFDVTFSATYWTDESNGNADYAGVILGIPINPVTGETDGINGVMQLRQGRLPGTEGDSWPISGGRNQAGTWGVDASASVNPDVYRFSSDFRPLRKIDETSFSALVNWDIGFAALRANIGVFDYEEFRLTDSDFSDSTSTWQANNPGVTPGTSTGDGYWQQCWGGPTCGLAAGQRVNSEAVQADVNLNSKGDGALQWTVGFFLYDDSGNGDTSSEFVWGYTDTTAPQNVTWGHWLYQGNGGTKSTAIYGQAEYSFTEETRVTVGLRQSEDERKFSNKYVDWGPSVHGYASGYYAAHYADPGSRFAPWPVFVATQATIDGAQKGDKSNTDWKLAVQHDINDEMMAYASIATGYIAGAIEGGGSTGLTKPNEVLSYELGLKSTLLDGTMRLNLAAFFNDYEGLTTSSFVAQGQTIVAVGTVSGTMESMGLEAEMSWAATEKLQINAGLALNKSQLMDFGRSVLNRVFQAGGDQEIGTAVPCDQTCSQVYVLDGQDARFSPSYTLSVDAAYEFDLGDKGRFVPGINLYLSDEYKTTNIPYFFTKQDSYTTMDLRGTWYSESIPLSIQGYVLNATDEIVQVGGDQFSQGRAVADFNNPRTWGIRLAYNF